MIYPLVRELAAEKIPVAVTCRVLGFSTQAYYKWQADPVSQRDWDDAHLINAAYDIHHDDPAFGYRFIADQLRERGLAAGENRVARLCSQQRIWSVFAKKRGLSRQAGPPVHDDLVDRQFTAPAPNLLWLTDITEHWTGEGKLYLCAIKDVYSGRIVGYSIDSRMKASLAVAALNSAITRRSPAGTVVHSDRGSQGGLNRPSQHLERGGVCDGNYAGAAAGGPALSGAGALARAADCGLARGSGPVLGRDRSWGEDRRRRCAGGRLIARCLPVVPSGWRREPVSACERVRPVSLLR